MAKTTKTVFVNNDRGNKSFKFTIQWNGNRETDGVAVIGRGKKEREGRRKGKMLLKSTSVFFFHLSRFCLQSDLDLPE